MVRLLSVALSGALTCSLSSRDYRSGHVETTPSSRPRGSPSGCRRRAGSALNGHGPARRPPDRLNLVRAGAVLAALRGDLGQSPSPEHILELKVCDPAMGSRAFLVETCRQLGDALIDAWSAHGGRPGDPARRGRGR